MLHLFIHIWWHIAFAFCLCRLWVQLRESESVCWLQYKTQESFHPVIGIIPHQHFPNWWSFKFYYKAWTWCKMMTVGEPAVALKSCLYCSLTMKLFEGPVPLVERHSILMIRIANAQPSKNLCVSQWTSCLLVFAGFTFSRIITY